MRRYARGHILYGVGVSLSPTVVHCGDENLLDVVIEEVDHSFFFVFNCLAWFCFNPCFVVVAFIFLVCDVDDTSWRGVHRSSSLQGLAKIEKEEMKRGSSGPLSATVLRRWIPLVARIWYNLGRKRRTWMRGEPQRTTHTQPFVVRRRDPPP